MPLVPRAVWPFENDILDYSGNGHNLFQLSGGVLPYVTGFYPSLKAITGPVTADGDATYLDHSLSGVVGNTANGIAISFWFQLNDEPAYSFATLAMIPNDSLSDSLVFSTSYNPVSPPAYRRYLQIANNGIWKVTLALANNNNWHHCYYSQSAAGTERLLCVDGVQRYHTIGQLRNFNNSPSSQMWMFIRTAPFDQLAILDGGDLNVAKYLYNEGNGRPHTSPGAWSSYGTLPPRPPELLGMGSQISFRIDEAGNNGSAITSYEIYRGTSSGSLSLLETVAKTGSNQLYTDATGTLLNTYFYSVKAVNANGASGFSAELSLQRLDPPSPVTSLTYNWTETEIILSWSEPNDNGSPITGYGISIVHDPDFDGSGWDGTEAEICTYTFRLADLAGHDSYEVWIDAYNDAGVTASQRFLISRFSEPAESSSESASISESRSCSDDVDHGLGRHSIAVDQPAGGGDNYPFVGQSDIAKLIADAYLSFADKTCEFARPFRVKWLYGFGCLKAFVPDGMVHNYEALIEDAAGKVVFDSREASSFTASLWGERLRVLQWLNSETDEVLRLVQHIAWSPNDTPRNWPVYLQPDNGQLDERVSERLLPRLRSLRIDLGDKQQGSIRLRNGFNTTLEKLNEEADDGDRLITSLVVSAAPGSGKGKYGPACDESSTNTPGTLRRINNIRGDDSGNFLLDATACYRIERPVLGVVANIGELRHVQVQDHTLRVSNDCGPCCECEDFINTYEGIRRLRDRYAELFERAKAIRDLYVKNRERFLASAECRKQDPLRLVIRPICPDEVAVAVGFCNNTDECLHGLVIPISFEFSGSSSFSECNADTEYTGGGTPHLTCNSTFRSGNVEENRKTGGTSKSLDYYNLGGEYPHFFAVWDRVDPGGLAQVTFRVTFPNSNPSDVVEVSADAYAISESDGILAGSSNSPIPGYELGTGPVAQIAHDVRLVENCKKVQTGLFQDDCC